MPTLYHIKGDPSNLYLIHPFRGNPRKISCEPVAQRLLTELEYEPGVLHNSGGDQIPTELFWALWETDLIGTDDVGDQDPPIEGLSEEMEASVPLREADLETLKELLESYTGQSRRSLEEVAEELGLALNENSQTSDSRIPPSDSTRELGNADDRRVDDKAVGMRLLTADVADEISTPEFKEWYEKTVITPRLEDCSLSRELTRTLVFLAQQGDVSSVKVSDINKTGEIKIVGKITPNQSSELSATPESIKFSTGDYLLPAEEHHTGSWDDEFPFVDWDVQSSFSPAGTDSDLDFFTGITILPTGISTVHTGIEGGTGLREEEFAARRHQAEIAEFVLRRHINNNGPFALPESQRYTEYHSSVEFHELPNS